MFYLKNENQQQMLIFINQPASISLSAELHLIEYGQRIDNDFSSLLFYFFYIFWLKLCTEYRYECVHIIVKYLPFNELISSEHVSSTKIFLRNIFPITIWWPFYISLQMALNLCMFIFISFNCRMYLLLLLFLGVARLNLTNFKLCVMLRLSPWAQIIAKKNKIK